MCNELVDILWFKDISKSDIPIAGGKGANLGEMINANIPVPNGFVITADAYYSYIHTTGLDKFIEESLENLDINNTHQLQNSSNKIIAEFKKRDLPIDLINSIKVHYNKLCGDEDKYVAVRSSATAEDLPEASFAGQQDTFLNISGWEDVVSHVQKVWASLFEARAIFYRATNGFSHLHVGIAVPVQLMVQSEVSGIMFTLNPITNDKSEISIEAAFGLGQPVVSGELTPDQYIVSKEKVEIISKNVVEQRWKMDINGNTIINRDQMTLQKLEDKHIQSLALIGKNIEDHYQHPQDIEWGMENGQIYIVQTRPITTINKVTAQKIDIDPEQLCDPLITGLAASPGVVSGRVRIISSINQIDEVKKGDILVSEMTNPDFVPAMKRASAIITNFGGRTSHAAIVSRELSIPAVVGTSYATILLHNNDIVTVDGNNGIIYPGNITHDVDIDLDSIIDTSNLITRTKLYVNLAEPEIAASVAERNCDGIGLLRAEFMMAQIGTHPQKYIEDNKQHIFINKLAQDMETFARSFYPRPVVYRFNDFKSNEYKNLIGGEKYERSEPNPMIGYRGVARYIKEPEVFKMELEAIKKVRDELNLKNLWVMLPFVRTVDQAKNIIMMVKNAGFMNDESLKIWMMVEIPSNVILLDRFIDQGIDGISIGTNDLTMLTLGVDRDNERVADVYNELDPAVLASLEKTVTTCARRGISCSICGQAPSVYPELVDMLVRWGVTSVSLSPDAIDKTRKTIYDAEQKIHEKEPVQNHEPVGVLSMLSPQHMN